MESLEICHPINGKIVTSNVRLVEHEQHRQLRLVQDAARLFIQIYVSCGEQVKVRANPTLGVHDVDTCKVTKSISKHCTSTPSQKHDATCCC